MSTPKPDRIVIDQNGNHVPLSPDDAERFTMQTFNDSELLFTMSRTKDGHYLAHVLGPPSLALAEALEDAAKSYRKALKARG